MAKNIIIFFINSFILKAIEGAVIVPIFVKDYRHHHLQPVIRIRQCTLNQYYDNDEGRCLIIPGGGYAVSIDMNGKCEKEIIRPDLSNKRRYSICRPSKIIHAECEDHRVFSSRFKRCVRHFHFFGTVNTQFHHYHYSLPLCQESGKFPAPNDRRIFYTCTSNGFRLYREIHLCPNNTVYSSQTQMCIDDSSYSIDGFSTTEFPKLQTTIMMSNNSEKTSNFINSTQSTAANDILTSEETTRSVPMISNEHLHQTYIYSTTEMPHFNTESYEQRTTDNYLQLQNTTENIPAKTTVKTTMKEVSTLEPLLTSVTEFPELLQSTSTSKKSIFINNDDNIEEIFTKSTTTASMEPFSSSGIMQKTSSTERSILINTDDNNSEITEINDNEEISTKSTTALMEPSSSSTIHADDQPNYLETINIPLTTPVTELNTTLMEEITNKEQEKFLDFTTNPTTELQDDRLTDNPNMDITESPDSFTTNYDVDTLSSVESSTMIDDIIFSQSTTERQQQFTEL